MVLYIHKISHNLKRVAEKHQVPVVFSASHKLSNACSMVTHVMDNHARRDTRLITSNAMWAYYTKYLSCGKSYIGQTGRCINERMRERNLTMNSVPSGHLAIHYRDCKWKPDRHSTGVISRYKNVRARKIAEAFHISRQKEKCISAPSVSLLNQEIQFLVK